MSWAKGRDKSKVAAVCKCGSVDSVSYQSERKSNNRGDNWSQMRLYISKVCHASVNGCIMWRSPKLKKKVMSSIKKKQRQQGLALSFFLGLY